MSVYPRSHGRKTSSQDWEIVPSDWWRTHYSSVSWVHIQDPAQDKKFQHQQFQGSLFSGPLLVHITGRRRPPFSKEDDRGHADTALNVDLVGVKAALDPLLPYERSVGFYYQALPKIEPEDFASLTALGLSTRVFNVEDTLVHQVRWNELLTNLMHSPLPESPSDIYEASESPSSVGDSLLHSTSTLSSVDLTSSEGSLESQPMPSTPRASSQHPVEVKDTSPTGSIRISPIRPLSASASSFFPSSSFHASSSDHPIKFPLIPETSRRSSKLSSFADFIFPSLNPPTSTSSSSASVKLKKDRDGFFTEESSTPTPLLPPFLQETSQRNTRIRKSRTREIVDRLRSESAPNEERGCNLNKGRHTVSPKYASYSPSPQLLDDFALSLIKPRRSVSEDGSGEQRQHRQALSTTSFSASVSASASASTSRLSTPEMEDDDGWIDIAHPTPSRSSPKDKSKRTRELFLALTRRRTDSISSEVFNDTTNQMSHASEGVSVAEEATDMSISSAPSPTTPPRTDIIRSVSTPPPMARTNTVTSTDGWIETRSTVHENSLKVQQKEKVPKKETHYRKKSQNSNPGHWARGSAFQPTPPSMPPHPVHAPNLPLSSFPPSTSTVFSHPPVLPPHVMPTSTTTTAGPRPMPYFFPSYPNIPMSVRIPPVTPVNYSTAVYNAMQVPNAYPMPPPPPPVPLQPYVAAPLPFSGMAPGVYSHASQPTSLPAKTGFPTAHSNTVAATSLSMPVGAGYSALNGSRGKW